ncbi:hypothetical protein NP233_g7611 [Leucocoprinus birnbaumii]|uniref:HhH-GPD domain-containing protein n=1 Tax=Leucocoprinus birnbaumii TaxID=56174 RepID=A0AAD5VQH4_9AGAR|nr:hypothetical protein NP233_g7611 [Leucocoprinus birnbaumii]
MILRSNARSSRRSPGLVAEIPVRSMASGSLSKRKRSSSPIIALKSEESSSIIEHSPQRTKKQKLQASFTKISPFPDYPHPTPDEASAIHQLLNTTHRPDAPAVRQPPQATSNSAQTCGHVPNVIEAVIGTILSQNTSGTNCTRAKRGLDAAFGRNNFEAMANARKEEVVDAIRTGGLANKKAGMIQGLLRDVKKRHGDYSLQHLAGEGRSARSRTQALLRDEEIMEELLSYDGVGPKTASCVLLFCLGRDSFAVDTHVYRLSRLLGWVPSKADRVLAQAHLDIRIPASLKYGLHVLMIQHGRACRGCKRPGSSEKCVLKDYLKQKTIKTEEEIDKRIEEVSQIKEEEPKI